MQLLHQIFKGTKLQQFVASKAQSCSNSLHQRHKVAALLHQMHRVAASNASSCRIKCIELPHCCLKCSSLQQVAAIRASNAVVCSKLQKLQNDAHHAANGQMQEFAELQSNASSCIKCNTSSSSE
jgi:hypothetical protein